MSLEHSLTNYETTPSGMVYPNPLSVNVGKYFGAANYHGMCKHIHDLSGGLVLTQPVEKDYRNPETKKYLDKYLHTKEGVEVEDRMRLYNLIRDITADSYGGWEFVTMLQAGGGLTAQKIVTYRSYDLEGAKRIAKKCAGIIEGKSAESKPSAPARAKETAGVS
jgi:4-hydroxybutyryl-CoA dehydratase/vinylacetyl-CoA-Delta-isomerase